MRYLSEQGHGGLCVYVVISTQSSGELCVAGDNTCGDKYLSRRNSHCQGNVMCAEPGHAASPAGRGPVCCRCDTRLRFLQSGRPALGCVRSCCLWIAAGVVSDVRSLDTRSERDTKVKSEKGSKFLACNFTLGLPWACWGFALHSWK